VAEPLDGPAAGRFAAAVPGDCFEGFVALRPPARVDDAALAVVAAAGPKGGSNVTASAAPAVVS